MAEKITLSDLNKTITEMNVQSLEGLKIEGDVEIDLDVGAGGVGPLFAYYFGQEAAKIAMYTEELVLENARLRKSLQLKEQSSAGTVSAEIIGRDAIGWFKTVLINKGKNAGIKKNQAVITHQGVVGRCIEVADNASTVLLITDINSSVDALVQENPVQGHC